MNNRSQFLKYVRTFAVCAGLLLPLFTMQAQFRVIIDTLDTSQYPEIRIVFRVMNGAQAFGGLTRSNFTVSENGLIQGPIDGGCFDSIQVFESSIMMLLDRSGSIKAAFPTVRAAAKSFIDDAVAGDEFAIYSFGGYEGNNNKRVSRECLWTSDKTVLKQAIDNILTPGGNTPLWDCIVAAKDEYTNNGKKRVMIVLTDGKDGYFEYDHVQVSNILNNASVRTFTIGLGSGIQEYVLQEVAWRTGGKYYEAPTAQELEDIYRAISQELTPSGNCEITYTANHDCLNGSTVTVELAVATGSLSAKATVSYVLPVDTSTYSYVDIMMNNNYIVDAGEEISIPLTLSRITHNRPATDFEFDIAFNTQTLELLNAAPTSLSDGYNVTFTPTAMGAKINLKGTRAIVDTGAIVLLTFAARDSDVSDKSQLVLSPMNIHQPCTESTADNGLVTINGFCERTVYRTGVQLLKTAILPNTPNPFNPTTVVRYVIGKEGNASMKLFDAAGREMRELVNNVLTPGEYSLVLDGSGLPNGAYYLKLESGGDTAMQRIVLLK